jgi:phage shock protein C
MQIDKGEYMSASTKGLLRSNDRIIAGVCGGIADWLGWPPFRVRLIYVVLSVFSAAFPGILVYLILWLIMPRAK